MYTLGRTPLHDFKYMVGIAYVALPNDLDRDTYIRDCYQNYTLSVWGEDGSFMKRLPVTPEVLNFIEFPVSPKELGSPVVYVTEETQSQPIIIGRFATTNSLGHMQEAEFKLTKDYDQSHVEIQGSPKTNSLSINLHSGPAAGNILVNLTGDQNGQFQVATHGDVVFNTSENVKLLQQGSFKTTTVDREAAEDDDSKDAVFEQLPGEHRIKNNKLTINEGEEPFVLGNKLKAFLSDLIDEVSKCTVSTAIGQQPLLNAAQIAAFKKRTDEFLSIVAYINK
ncbi:hypothetical protein ACTJJ0_30825 [Chitinophaga sp. 22321]|uniref:Uncharacterized protein n=1 Tax=Chitinophaga hostae TaxID=2831022 RepID=A0ABS5J8S3_9BACT|nr:hypothetical protein [Chitinophaga hostae]MBS0031609.1 hypothetical protein [Chitinophaga hostae]